MKSKIPNNDKSSNIDRLSKFDVELLSGLTEGNVYANGNMQVGVNVLIQAADNNDSLIILSDEQLDGIQLIDYSTGEELSGGWAYSTKENEYTHTFPGETSPQILDSLYKEQANSSFQIRTYWVTTSSAETIQIGAKIKLDSQTYSIQDGASFGSHVIVVGHSPINYDSDSLNIEEQKNIKSGKYKVVRVDSYSDWTPKKTKSTEYHKWSQTNYYIKPKNEFTVKDAHVWNTAYDDDPSNIQFRRFSYLTNNDNLYIFYLWGTYQNKNKKAGWVNITKSFHTNDLTGEDSEFTASPQVYLDTLNPNTDVVSVTKLYFSPPYPAFWGEEGYYEPYFNFHDIYGNRSGNIRVIINEDHQSFHLQDADND
ncbi:hypothetical protein J8V57_11750 [Xenorhabdus sp. PB61.4]|uniref:hypothetical protein n=1 Tax=Xenorhabdus TaxID=626 RepID=UPI001E5953BE|nr:hypothetical protein [Xenorhabdus sp. PB61.4]MCC8366944.1 hypothetical protein [Xenorhabdus sp. PB61.4]